MKAIKAKVLRVEHGEYTKVVIECNDQYEILTIKPNWRLEIKEGKEYFIQIENTKAGETDWYDEATGEHILHRYTADYLHDAVMATEDKEKATAKTNLVFNLKQ